MSKLSVSSALGGFTQSWNGMSVTEFTEYELISLATAQGSDKDFKSKFKNALGTTIPAPNQILPATGGSVMWMAPHQYFVMLGATDVAADLKLTKQFGESAYCVLQSDAWACLKVEGEKALDVFERFLPLDMRNAAPDFAARTTAHHIAVIVAKLLDGTYLLLTPRSSAHSFLDALTHTIENVIS